MAGDVMGGYYYERDLTPAFCLPQGVALSRFKYQPNSVVDGSEHPERRQTVVVATFEPEVATRLQPLYVRNPEQGKWLGAPLEAIMKENQLLWGVNGSMYLLAERLSALGLIRQFSGGLLGRPLGCLVIDGKVLQPPLHSRHAAILDGSRWRIGRLSMKDIIIVLDGVKFSVDRIGSVNYDGKEEIVVFSGGERFIRSRSPFKLLRTPAREGCTDIAIVDDKVLTFGPSGSLKLPVGGFILSVPDSRLSSVKTDNGLFSVETDVSYELNDPNIRHVMASGPSVLFRVPTWNIEIDGGFEQIVPEMTSDYLRAAGFPPGSSPLPFFNEVRKHAKQFAPRTIFGVREDGSVVIAVFEGRTDDSWGITLEEAGEYMKTLGCIDAMAFDGGASAEMRAATINGESKRLTAPGPASGREVVNAFFRAAQPVVPNGTLPLSDGAARSIPIALVFPNAD